MNRSYLITGLIILFVILLSLFWWGLSRQQLPWQSQTASPIFSITAADIAKLAITFDRPADQFNQPNVVLAQQDNSWYLASDSGQIAVDQDKIDQVITALLDLKRTDPVSMNPANHSIYQVDSGLTVVVTTNQGDTIVHLGKIGPDYGSQYFRLDSEDQVYLHPSILRSLFTQKDWTASPSAETAGVGE